MGAAHAHQHRQRGSGAASGNTAAISMSAKPSQAD
jgi:hypothetical protein